MNIVITPLMVKYHEYVLDRVIAAAIRAEQGYGEGAVSIVIQDEEN